MQGSSRVPTPVAYRTWQEKPPGTQNPTITSGMARIEKIDRQVITGVRRCRQNSRAPFRCTGIQRLSRHASPNRPQRTIWHVNAVAEQSAT